MDDISWADLDPEEQRTIAFLGAGFSVELCDRVALLTLKRVGLVRGSGLTRAAEQLRRKAIRRQFGSIRGSACVGDPTARKVVVLQWPCGTLAVSLLPNSDQPRKMAMLVLVQVSSMKTRRSGSTWP